MNNDLTLEDVLLMIAASDICPGDYGAPWDEEWVEDFCPTRCKECWRRSFQLLKDEGKLNVQ